VKGIGNLPSRPDNETLEAFGSFLPPKSSLIRLTCTLN
jgi:hypothetical protein